MACATCQEQMGDPVHLPDRFVILGNKVYNHLYISITATQCKSCQQKYYVMKDPGYHTPQYNWYSNKSDVEQITGESVAQITMK